MSPQSFLAFARLVPRSSCGIRRAKLGRSSASPASVQATAWRRRGRCPRPVPSPQAAAKLPRASRMRPRPLMPLRLLLCWSIGSRAHPRRPFCSRGGTVLTGDGFVVKFYRRWGAEVSGPFGTKPLVPCWSVTNNPSPSPRPIALGLRMRIRRPTQGQF